LTYKYMYSYPKVEKKIIVKRKKKKKKKPKKSINYRGLYISSLKQKKIRDAHGNRTEEMKKMIKQKFTTLMA